MLTTRQIAKETDPISLQAVSGIIASVVLLPVVLVGDAYQIELLGWIHLNSYPLFLLLGIGILGTGVHLWRPFGAG